MTKECEPFSDSTSKWLFLLHHWCHYIMSVQIVPILVTNSKNQFEFQSWSWWISKSSLPFFAPKISVLLICSNSFEVSHSIWKIFWLVDQYRSTLVEFRFCFASWWSWYSRLKHVHHDFHSPAQTHSSFSQYQAIRHLEIGCFPIFSRRLIFLEKPWRFQRLDRWLSIGLKGYQRYRTAKDESSCFDCQL